MLSIGQATATPVLLIDQEIQPGFRCICEPGDSGEFCQWTELPAVGSGLAAPLIINAISLSVLFLVVLVLLVSLRLRRHRQM
ncbi:hypothetical protein O3P69_006005 [Scylla paramamosain]|uniref:Uncharacterized protein n=1 Tax=Scylla paramamosain TaxID=85552 RepID=A0AAW0U5A1_SCYPA